MVNVTVVGCGVVGLTTAVLLQRWGAKVTIRTRTSPSTAHADPHYASVKAGAHWFSFAMPHEARKKALDELSFHALIGLALTEPDSGVMLVRGHALFEKAPAPAAATAGATSSTAAAAAPTDPAAGLPELPWFHNLVPRFRQWSAAEIAERARPENGGVEYARAFSYETVMLNAPHYLTWLLRQFKQQGGVLREGDELRSLADAWVPQSGLATPDVVVNCTGMGAKSLSDVRDRLMEPDRGQIIIVRCPAITDIWRVPADLPTYVLPRGDGTVILGGTHQYGDGNVTPDPAVADAILARCSRAVPLLRNPANYNVLSHSVGLRPGRCGVGTVQRIEVDEQLSAQAKKALGGAVPDPLVVHSYGHGGDGFQSSWGSAIVVAHLIMRARPKLFEPMRDQLFHMRHGHYKTGVLERAMQPDMLAKL